MYVIREERKGINKALLYLEASKYVSSSYSLERVGGGGFNIDHGALVEHGEWKRKKT